MGLLASGRQNALCWQVMYVRFHGAVPFASHGPLHHLRAPCAVIEEIAGAPEDDFGDKVSTAWCFQCLARPLVVLLVHDIQDEDDRSFSRSRFRAQPAYDWRVTGPTQGEVTEFCQWLSAEVIRRVEAKGTARRLTAESRERINALLREGVSPGEATKRAAVWEETRPSAAQFTWPPGAVLPQAGTALGDETEVHLLQRAQSALGADPSAALALTVEHTRRFAGGSLVQERELIAVSALLALGRTPEARGRADSLLARFPSSPYRGRLESLGLGIFFQKNEAGSPRTQ